MLSFERQEQALQAGYLRLGLGFVAAYLLLMLLWVPAGWVYQQLLPSEPSQHSLPVIKRLSGSLWRGTAEGVMLPLAVRSLGWQWDMRALLSASWGYRLTLNSAQDRARVAVSLDGAARVKDLQLNGRLSAWVSTFQGQSLPLDVEISASLTDARIGRQGCTTLQEGRVALQDWQGLMSESLNRLGRIEANLSCVGGSLQVDFEGSEAAVQLSGRWVLNPDLSYLLTVEAHPQALDIKDSLSAVGFVQRASGVWLFRRQGTL
ncbi:MAG: hypothetical protein ACI9W6_000193 [Motiliproteus sp.]|jgi:hypothetical protein